MSEAATIETYFRPEIDFAYDPLPNLPELLQEMAETGQSVVRVRYQGGDAWAVVGYDNVSSVFRNEAEIPAGPHYRVVMSAIGRTIETMEGAEQRAYKTVMSRWFSPKNVGAMKDAVILPIIDELIDDFGERRAVDLNPTFSRRLGFNVISRLVGVDVAPEAEAEVHKIVEGMNQMLDPHVPPEENEHNALKAVARADAMLLPVVEARRAQPRDDFISYLVQAEVEGRPLTDEEILSHARLIYLAGADSTGLMLDNAMAAILARPDLLQRMLADRSIRDAVVDEMIRLESASGLVVRRAINDVEIDGVTVPAGAYILMAVPNANRDAARFPSPEEVRVDRRGADLSLSFGAGPHLCLGKHLAKMEVQLAVERLLDRLPGLRLDGPEKRPTGSQFRFIAGGLPVRFDDVLTAPVLA